VLDAHAPGQAGGSGQAFDWSRVPRRAPRPWLLAGGLHPDNVFDAILATRPFAVDVSSGIEQAPGVKCPRRMARFVAEVQRADAQLAQVGNL
jgi:phosphoribosylanthranilate isomerase